MSDEPKTYESIVEEGKKLSEKVESLFVEIAGNRAAGFGYASYPHRIAEKITAALIEDGRDAKCARDIAFHMSDWLGDAAFVVALNLFPDNFSNAEVRNGIDRFLCHAPAHIIAAARLNGDSTEDFFLTHGD